MIATAGTAPLIQSEKARPGVDSTGTGRGKVTTDAHCPASDCITTSGNGQEEIYAAVNIDSVPYQSKEAAKTDYAVIRSRMCKPERIFTVSASRLLECILSGYTWTPQAMTGTSGKTFMQQRIFAIDIDNQDDKKSMIENPVTVEKAQSIMEAANIPVLFAYYTFSHTQQWPRFRLAVATDRAVTDPEQAKKITKGLISLFHGAADDSAWDTGRMFLGTNIATAAIPYTNQTVPVERLTALAGSESIQVKRNPENSGILSQAIESFDMGTYVAQTTGTFGVRRGGRLMFNPCPVCGHMNDFYTDGNTWKCFGASGPGKGGNIINYLEVTKGFTRKQARDYFMYDVLKWNKEKTQKSFIDAHHSGKSGVAVVDKAERPDFVTVTRRKDPETGGFVDVEHVDCPMLAQTIREQEHFFFVKNDVFDEVNRFWYKDGVYKLICDDEFKGRIKSQIDAWNPRLLKMRDVREVFDILVTDDNFTDDCEMNSEELAVNFKNGIYYPVEDKLKPHDPTHFMTRQIPFTFPDTFTQDQCCDYTQKTPVWNNFLAYLSYGPKYDRTNDMTEEERDAGSRRYQFLMEWIAVLLSNIPGGRFKKSLWMVGPGNSGKSKLLEFVCYLLGKANCFSTDLEKIHARFGAAPMYNKRLVFTPDQKFARIPEMDIFKELSGEDAIQGERKGKQQFNFMFTGLYWACMNKLPTFGGDKGEHVYDRMIIFKTPEGLPKEKRDPFLIDKLKAEAPYIIPQILCYLPEVVNNGYRFHEPRESEQARKEYAAYNDPVMEWLDECCVDVENPGEYADTVEAWKRDRDKPAINKVYAVYKQWCTDYNGGRYMTRKAWKERLKDISGESNVENIQYHDVSGTCLKRWILTDKAREDYEYVIR